MDIMASNRSLRGLLTGLKNHSAVASEGNISSIIGLKHLFSIKTRKLLNHTGSAECNTNYAMKHQRKMQSRPPNWGFFLQK
jgi:hypothetical protein